MKITDIKSYPVWVGSRNQMLVKIETDEGIYGWGESGLSYRELAVAGAIKHYREWLIGRDPMQRGALWQEMYRSQYFEGGRVLAAAQSAIDIALYDIVGKALNVPVYQLLGGKQRDYVPCFASTGANSPETLIEAVQLLLSHGWNVIRTFAVNPQRIAGSPMVVARASAPAPRPRTPSSSRAIRLGRRQICWSRCARRWGPILCWGSTITTG